MVFTKIMFHRRVQRRWSASWRTLAICLLLIGYAAFAWAQFPPPIPGMAPPLFGAQVEGVDATADTVVDFTLDSGLVLSGEITTANGAPAFGATVFAQSETEIYSGSTTFAIDPTNPLVPIIQYRLIVPAGTYSLSIHLQVIGGSATSPTLLSFVTFDLQETVMVNSDTEKDLVVPVPPEFFTVSGQIVNPGTFPSNGLLRFQSEGGRVFNGAEVDFATEGAASASYSLTLPAGTYNVTYFPNFFDEVDPNNPMPPQPDPEVSQQSLFISVGTVTVSANQIFDATLPATGTLSGRLVDSSGVAVAGATVFAVMGLPFLDGVAGGDPPPQEPPAPTAALCQTGSLTTILDLTGAGASLPEGNTIGEYEMSVVPGPEPYQVAVNTPLALLPPATVPPDTLDPQKGDLTFPFPPDMITIMADQMRDFASPPVPGVAVISGNVTDGQNQPVSRAQVSAESSMLTETLNVLFSNGVETNETGDYQLLVLSGVEYTLTVCPPQPISPFGIPAP